MHDTIASVFSVALAILGLSYVIQAPKWAAVYIEFEAHPRRYLPTGIMMFAAGLWVGLYFNDWSGTWPIFITVFGWLMALEGLLMAVWPASLTSFTRLLGSSLARFVRLGGLLVLGLGCLLVWEYVLQDLF